MMGFLGLVFLLVLVVMRTAQRRNRAIAVVLQPTSLTVRNMRRFLCRCASPYVPVIEEFEDTTHLPAAATRLAN
jgi:hypothetical protein